MSYILDALKKIEHEKITKTLPGAGSGISGGLFNDRKPQSGRAGARKIVVILVLVVLGSVVTFGITWFVLKGNTSKQVATAPTVALPVTPQPVPAPQPQSQLQPQPVAPSVIAPPAAPVEVVLPEEEQPRSKGAAATKKSTPVAIRAPQVLKPASQTIPPPADIKVSGIAWQDEHTARRAVVNGFLLKEGSLVAGAKISAIMADRVRFSTADGVFELRLDASAPGELKR